MQIAAPSQLCLEPPKCISLVAVESEDTHFLLGEHVRMILLNFSDSLDLKHYCVDLI